MPVVWGLDPPPNVAQKWGLQTRPPPAQKRKVSPTRARWPSCLFFPVEMDVGEKLANPDVRATMGVSGQEVGHVDNMAAVELWDVDNPPNNYAWQRQDVYATRNGIAPRTVRRRVSAGRLERMETGGRVYVRESAASDTGRGRTTRQPDADPDVFAAALVVALEARLDAVRREHDVRVARMQADITDAMVSTAELELLAEVATRDAERFRDELAASELELAEEREQRRRLELAAALPWYAFRRRRELLETAKLPLLR